MTLLFSPTPERSFKRKIANLEDPFLPLDVKRWKNNNDEQIHDWLSNQHIKHRPLSAPPYLDLTVCNMSQQEPNTRSIGKPSTPSSTIAASVISSRMKTDDPHYPKTIYSNGIIVDRSGTKMPKDVRAFVEEHIVNKPRSSPPLPQEELKRVITVSDQVANSSEGAVYDIVNTAMFPIMQDGVVGGGDTPFSSEPLPSRPEAFYELAVPRPDRHYGYPTGQNGDFSRPQNDVLDHPYMKKYSQPTSDCAFPFLIIEIKSEAKGGTLWHAENQAAGSGSHCVNAMAYLIHQAEQLQTREFDPIKNLKRGADLKDSISRDGSHQDSTADATKALAFSICLTARNVMLYVHSYSSTRQEYLMSLVSSFLPSKIKDIQECRNQVKNILDFALQVRRKRISEALDALYPFPPSWPSKRNKQRGRGTPCSTPATSFNVQTESKDR